MAGAYDEADHQQLQTTLIKQGVKYALAGFVDVHGICKGKVVPLGHLSQIMQGSELFTGTALDGVPQAINDEEVSAYPDLGSPTVLPWNPSVVWFASDLYLQGQPFEACCRGILQRVLHQAAAMGYGFNLGIETEFFILRDTEGGGYAPVSDRDTLAKLCYDLTGLLDHLPWVTEIVEAMNSLGWDVYACDFF